MTQHSTVTAGIDTSKKELHLGFWPRGKRLKVGNGEQGFEALAAALDEAKVKRVGIESTSIYHRAAAAFLAARGFEVVVLQPGQVKAFAEIHRKKAKRDPSDAELIAGCAGLQVEVHAPHDPSIAKLSEHLTYIEQCEDNLARLKTQKERFAQGPYRAKIEAEIKRLERRLGKELKALEAKLRAKPELDTRLDLVTSVPGVGLRSGLAVLIRMPELGSLSPAKAAALLGVAPFDDDTGEHQGERHIHGGRARARKSLYMAAFSASSHHNPQLKTFRERLLGRGKAHTLAVIACTRKLIILLNAILARGTPWTTERPKRSEGMPCPQ
jgi:transposase